MGSSHFADDSGNNCLIAALIVPISSFEQPKNATGVAFEAKFSIEGRLFSIGGILVSFSCAPAIALDDCRAASPDAPKTQASSTAQPNG